MVKVTPFPSTCCLIFQCLLPLHCHVSLSSYIILHDDLKRFLARKSCPKRLRREALRASRFEGDFGDRFVFFFAAARWRRTWRLCVPYRKLRGETHVRHVRRCHFRRQFHSTAALESHTVFGTKINAKSYRKRVRTSFLHEIGC